MSIVFLLQTLAIGQTTVRYIGPYAGLWSNPANWDLEVVPANNGVDSYNVIIPADSNVVFDLMTPTQITGLSMEPASSLNFNDTSLEVVGVALLETNLINASGAAAEFLSNSPFASGENQQAVVANGATVQFALSNYVLSDSGLRESTYGGPFLSATDPGSTLNLSSITLLDTSSLNHGWSGSTFTVTASNQGVVDMSNITTINGASGGLGVPGGPGTPIGSWLKLRAVSGGHIDLSHLTQINGAYTWFQLAGGTISASNLVSVTNTRFEVPNGETLNLGTDITRVTGTEFLLENGATINAPNLTDFSGSRVMLTPTTVFNVPVFTEIDNSQIHVKEGRSFAVSDNKYLLTNAWLREDSIGGPFLSSTDLGSTLDLSSISLIDTSSLTQGWSEYVFTVMASKQGVVDMAGVTVITGTRDGLPRAPGTAGGSWLKLRAESGGHIDLSNLTEIAGRNTWFQLAGGTINISSLASVAYTRFEVPIFQTLDLGTSLTTATGSEFLLENGATINAPNLTDFSGSKVTLTPTTFFNVPEFTAIDDAQIHVKEGRTYAVADNDYLLSNGHLHEGWIGGPFLSAEDSNSTLDLSSLTLIDSSEAVGWSGNTFTVTASNQGVVNLTGLTEIFGAGGGDPWLKFRSESGGRIDFGSLGAAQFGSSGSATGAIWMDVDHIGSKLLFEGDLILQKSESTQRQPRISATDFGEFHVRGDMYVFTDDSAEHDTSGGILFMEGSGIQEYGVRGEEIGLPTDAIDNNFNWGRMVIGQESQATTVVLMDMLDQPLEGNSALYLSGFPQGESGLQLLGGSTLVLNGLNAYVGGIDGDEADWILLNSLFGAGENVIPYGGGFLQLNLTHNLYSADFDGDGDVDGDDFLVWQSSFSNNAGGDSDFDGDSDGNDFLLWQRQFGGMTGECSSATVVPEPANLILLIIAIMGIVCGRYYGDE
ncbi:MAG: hypothetical protein JW829_11370 [Pirellulales bacterium]|nr:hypothetical protein [Pirellulales bacterium]